MHTRAAALALLLAPSTSLALGQEPADIRQAAVAPRDASMAVPTNARLFVDVSMYFAGTLSRDGQQLMIENQGLGQDGIPLGPLSPSTDYRLHLSDTVQTREVAFRTGAGPDEVAPAAPGAPTATVCSYFTQCDGPGFPPAEGSAETFRIRVTVPRADDDLGVALYRLYQLDDDGARQPAVLLHQSTLEDGAGFVHWQEEPATGDEVALIHAAEIAAGEDAKELRFVVTAVDLAANESEPSEPIVVALERSTSFGGCASMATPRRDAPGLALALLGLLPLALLRRSRASRAL